MGDFSAFNTAVNAAMTGLDNLGDSFIKYRKMRGMKEQAKNIRDQIATGDAGLYWPNPEAAAIAYENLDENASKFAMPVPSNMEEILGTTGSAFYKDPTNPKLATAFKDAMLGYAQYQGIKDASQLEVARIHEAGANYRTKLQLSDKEDNFKINERKVVPIVGNGNLSGALDVIGTGLKAIQASGAKNGMAATSDYAKKIIDQAATLLVEGDKDMGAFTNGLYTPELQQYNGRAIAAQLYQMMMLNPNMNKDQLLNSINGKSGKEGPMGFGGVIRPQSKHELIMAQAEIAAANGTLDYKPDTRGTMSLSERASETIKSIMAMPGLSDKQKVAQVNAVYASEAQIANTKDAPIPASTRSDPLQAAASAIPDENRKMETVQRVTDAVGKAMDPVINKTSAPAKVDVEKQRAREIAPEASDLTDNLYTVVGSRAGSDRVAKYNEELSKSSKDLSSAINGIYNLIVTDARSGNLSEAEAKQAKLGLIMLEQKLQEKALRQKANPALTVRHGG